MVDNPKGRSIKNLRLEDILAEELKREMLVTSGLKFRYIDEWDTIMRSIYELPIEYDGYVKKLSDSWMLKEVIDVLTKGDFDDVKRSESRRKQLREFKKMMQMYYNLIFTKGGERIGYGTLIYFPNLIQEEPERSRGIILLAKHVIKDKKSSLTFEKVKFDDFLLEVRPYIEILGDLYRGIKK